MLRMKQCAMMPAIIIYINILYIAAIAIVAFALGYYLRSRLLKVKGNRIRELEEEMLDNHARILELERQISMMSKRHEKI